MIKKIIIVTGCSGAGKSIYSNSIKIPKIHYDIIFNYNDATLDYNYLDNFVNNLSKDDDIILLDGFNNDLVNYFISKNIYNFDIIFLYTDLDENYNNIVHSDRYFKEEYDQIISTIISENKLILNNINNINKKENIKLNIIYKYRKGDIYTDYQDNKHLLEINIDNKKERLLNFIKETSGHYNYQSIILENEIIIESSEKDWITFEKIQNIIDMNDKVILDTGCFNGFFSFKTLQNNPKKVIGIDCNKNAINICKKICIYNNFHKIFLNKKIYNSPIDFFEYKIGIDNIFEKIECPIDIIFVFNYLHHLINELGHDIFIKVVDSFFKNTKEIIFEVNDKEISDIHEIALKNNFELKKKIESHRKTIFGNRWIMYYKKNLIYRDIDIYKQNKIKKIFLFGYTGMLGNYIYNYFKNKIETIQIDYKIKENIDINLLENILIDNKIDENSLIINCIGQIPQRKFDDNNKVYFLVNSIFPNILYTICKKYSSRMIQPTTDCVFTGKRINGMYNEKDIHDETNYYGMSKSIGEPCESTVIRTSIIGLEKRNKKSFMEWVLNSLKNDISIEGWENHLWNGITCLEYCKVINYMIENNYFWKGVRHIYSPTQKSKYEISCMIADIFGYNKNLIKKINTNENINKTLSSVHDFPYKINELENQLKEIFLLENL